MLAGSKSSGRSRTKPGGAAAYLIAVVMLAAVLTPFLPAPAAALLGPGEEGQPVESAIEPGDADIFWTQDWGTGMFSPRVAKAKYVGEHVVIFVDGELSTFLVDELGGAFDTVIYPTLTAAYGGAPNPGLDDDPRIVILIYDFNDPLGDIDASFNPRDIDPNGGFSSTLAPSNLREMFYLNLNALYAQTTLGPTLAAHEFTHLLIHYRDVMLDSSPDAAPESRWIEEGFSTYGEHLCGYDQRVASQLQSFTRDPNFSLTNWRGFRENYGASYSFMSYLAEREGGEFIRALTEQPLDGPAGIDATLAARGSTSNFASLFDDWVLAGFLDGFSPEIPPYLFRNLSVSMQREQIGGVPPLLGTGEVANYGAVYVDFPAASPSKAFQIVCDGADGSPLQAALISWDSGGAIAPVVDRLDLANPAVGATMTGPLGYDRHALAVWARGAVGSTASCAFTYSGSTDPPGGIQFLDMGGSDSFYKYVGVLLDRGVVSGRQIPTGSGLWFFKGKDDVLRAQFAKMIMEATELHTVGWETGTPTFRDVKEFDANGYPYDYVEEAYEYGVVKGYAGGYFRPWEPIQRAHLVLMIQRGAEAADHPLPSYAGHETIFADVPPAHPYYDEIMSAWSVGIFEGSPGPNGRTYFYPGSPASRNHVAKMTANLLAYLALP